jgi:hypothetical protein
MQKLEENIKDSRGQLLISRGCGRGRRGRFLSPTFGL